MIFQTREVPNTQQNMVENNKCGKCKKLTPFETKNVHSGLSDLKYVFLLESSIEF